MGWDTGGWKLHGENPDIDFIAPKSGALGWIDTFALPAKAKNVDGAYKWINFMLRPENAAVFSNKEKCPTASKDASTYLDAEVRDNLNRSFTATDIDNIKWYPPVSAEIEQLEGKLLDKVQAAK
jgi:spermidine/putrescine transport system substrate-binding protein